MELPPPRAISLHTLLLSLLFLSTAAAAATALASADTVAPPAPSPSPKPSWPTQSATTFLRDRCATTLYPDVCYDSLLPYAGTFQTSRVRLARAAADVAAARIRDLSARLEDLRRRHQRDPCVAGGPRGTAALEDCTSTVPAAAGLASRSSAELARLVADEEEEGGSSSSSSSSAAARRSRRRRAISNAQTWLSAAMSDEETCADGFAEAGEAAMGSPAGKLAAAGVASVRQYTSNALALVNGIPV